jgi:hypothetical protein
MDYNDAVIEEGVNNLLIVAEKRRQLLDQLKQAVKDDDIYRIKEYASKICGVQ